MASRRREDGDAPAQTGDDRRPRIFVWTVWAAMLLVALACAGAYGRNVPLSEDWTLVPALTNHEPDFIEWLWSQNNEHRVPLPRLLLLGLLKVTGGDFRAGMVASVVLLAGLAAMMMLAARRVRGGRTMYSDAFFPVVILNLGNWENLFWSWQLSFVSSVILIGGLLLFVVTQVRPIPPRTASFAGIALVLLPLTGATGLVFVPVLGIYMAAQGVLQWRDASADTPTWSTVWLVGFSLIALAVTGLYFLGYESPAWYPPSELNLDFAKTSLKFLAIAFGPASARSWALSSLIVIALLGCSTLLLLSSARSRAADRIRARGLLLVLVGVGIMAAAVGRGRGAVPGENMPNRYALLALTALLTLYFAWELYGSPRAHRGVLNGLFVVALLLLPLNTSSGLQWRDWYLEGVNSFQRDLDSGLPAHELAQKHRSFLLHWDVEALEANMIRLRDAGFGPFRGLAAEPVDSVSR